MAHFTAKYGDLIDTGIITPEMLPPSWANFPATALPDGTSVTFSDLFYMVYQNREIAGDTVATFLRFLKSTTFEVLEMLPNGLYDGLLAAAVFDDRTEDRENRVYSAPEGDLSKAYTLGGDAQKITVREPTSQEHADYLMKNGKPLVLWIADRYEKCFVGVY